jgi:hypothetical protein
VEVPIVTWLPLDGTRPRVWLGVLAVATVVQAAGLAAGWWPATLVVGFATGLVVRRSVVVLALLLATIAAWTTLIWWESGGRAGEVADLVGAMATGARGSGWMVFAATYAFAMLSALTGAWLGGAARRLALGGAARRLALGGAARRLALGRRPPAAEQPAMERPSVEEPMPEQPPAVPDRTPA